MKNPRVSRRKEILKIRAEINAKETRGGSLPSQSGLGEPLSLDIKSTNYPNSLGKNKSSEIKVLIHSG